MDSEIIDLTDESKNDLADDSRYGKIEDSIQIDFDDGDQKVDDVNDSSAIKNDSHLHSCLNDVYNSSIIKNDNALNYDLSTYDVSRFKKIEESNFGLNYGVKELSFINDDPIEELNDDHVFNQIREQNTSANSEATKSAGEHEDSNPKLIDDFENIVDDDIVELDNELSIIHIVTPDKQKLDRNLNFFSPIDSPKFTSLKRNLGETSFNQELKVSDLEDDLGDDLVVNPCDVNKRKQKRRAKLTDQEKKDKEAEKLKEKERKKLEKEESNRQKEKLKQKERKLKEANKYLNLRNSSQYCTTIVSQILVDKFLASNALIIKAFEEAELNLSIDHTIPEPFIKWKRTLHNRDEQMIADKSVVSLSDILIKEEVEEDHLIMVLSKERFVKMVYNYVLESKERPEEAFEFDENDIDNISLLNYVIKLIRQHRKSVVLIIYNLEAYFRSLKNREHRDFLNLMSDNQSKQKRVNKSKLPLINRINVEESILNANLELMKNDEIVEWNVKVNFLFADNQSDLLNLICNLSNSMSNAPLRRWRNAQEGFEWFVDGDCKTGSVNLKDLPADVNKLWLKHLLLFNKVSLPIAKSITQVYPNLMELKDKYDSLENLEDKESLLSKIIIQNTNRTINIDISKRIYKFLTETDEDEILV